MVNCKDLNIPPCFVCYCAKKFVPPKLEKQDCWMEFWQKQFQEKDNDCLIRKYIDMTGTIFNKQFYLLKAAELYNKDLYEKLCKLVILK
jgi:hypothetical protein